MSIVLHKFIWIQSYFIYFKLSQKFYHFKINIRFSFTGHFSFTFSQQIDTIRQKDENKKNCVILLCVRFIITQLCKHFKCNSIHYHNLKVSWMNSKLEQKWLDLENYQEKWKSVLKWNIYIWLYNRDNKFTMRITFYGKRNFWLISQREEKRMITQSYQS